MYLFLVQGEVRSLPIESKPEELQPSAWDLSQSYSSCNLTVTLRHASIVYCIYGGYQKYKPWLGVMCFQSSASLPHCNFCTRCLTFQQKSLQVEACAPSCSPCCYVVSRRTFTVHESPNTAFNPAPKSMYHNCLLGFAWMFCAAIVEVLETP